MLITDLKELQVKKTKSLNIVFVCETDSNEIAEERLCDALAKIITAPMDKEKKSV